jgi:alkaline phosphatase
MEADDSVIDNEPSRPDEEKGTLIEKSAPAPTAKVHILQKICTVFGFVLLGLFFGLMIFINYQYNYVVESAACPENTAADLAAPNLIIFITDGMGSGSVTLAREVECILQKSSYCALASDAYLRGHVRTRSLDSLVTDSAAGATAFSTGFKTANKKVGVDLHNRPLRSIFEAARAKGMRIGLVSTTFLTDATPAGFSSHVSLRSEREEIANQQAAFAPDVMLGGGRAEYKHAISLFKDKGYVIPYDCCHLASNCDKNAHTPDNANKTLRLPTLALCAEESMAYEIDRKNEPSLLELTKSAIDMLEKGEYFNLTTGGEAEPPRCKHINKGYMLLVEAARIDHAGHANDAATQAREVLAWDKAFMYAVEKASNGTNTLVLSVSDHETGGVSLATFQGSMHYEKDSETTVYRNISTNATAANTSRVVIRESEKSAAEFFPGVIEKAQMSASEVAAFITATLTPKTAEVPESGERNTVYLFAMKMYFDIHNMSDDELASIEQETMDVLNRKNKNSNRLAYAIANIVNKRARVGFSTTKHTGADVNMYAYGYNADLFSGIIENTEIARKIAHVFSLDMDFSVAAT